MEPARMSASSLLASVPSQTASTSASRLSRPIVASSFIGMLASERPECSDRILALYLAPSSSRVAPAPVLLLAGAQARSLSSQAKMKQIHADWAPAGPGRCSAKPSSRNGLLQSRSCRSPRARADPQTAPLHGISVVQSDTGRPSASHGPSACHLSLASSSGADRRPSSPSGGRRSPACGLRQHSRPSAPSPAASASRSSSTFLLRRCSTSPPSSSAARASKSRGLARRDRVFRQRASQARTHSARRASVRAPGARPCWLAASSTKQTPSARAASRLPLSLLRERSAIAMQQLWATSLARWEIAH
mmetsp:Transcript_32201/g.76570  ORF Transcript_32201/g.76570 Transcript_32201/m.76570 type:complete len:305 (+) Transcript_32201:937-1851(+)